MKFNSIFRTPNRAQALLLFFTLTAYSNHSLSELPTLGDPTLDTFSTSEEVKLGRAFYQSLRANLEFVDDPQLNHYLKSLAQKIVTHSDAAGNSFRFFIINSSSINAFAGPDGHIGINSGLFLASTNESQLASVLAHEISHISQRHLARAIATSGNTAIATFATILAAILLGSQDSQAGQAVLYSGLAGTQQASLNFTRANEYEADRIGIGIMTDAGIDPQGMVEFFETLLRQGGGGDIEYLRSHPLNTNRVSEAKNRISSHQKKLPNDSSDYQFAHARLSALVSPRPDMLATTQIAVTDQVKTYRQSIALIKISEYKKAITLLKPLAENNPHPWIKLALAEAYNLDGQPEDSIQILQELSKLYPGYLPVTLAYAETLTGNNQPQKSISQLKHQLQLDDDPVIHKMLARAYFANGQISAALESTGNQYAREGYMELALQQYVSALQQADISVTTRQRLESKKKELKEKTQE